MFVAVKDEKMIKTVEDLALEIWNEYFVPMIGQKAVDYVLCRVQSKEAISKQIQEGYRYYLIQENGKWLIDELVVTDEEVDADNIKL